MRAEPGARLERAHVPVEVELVVAADDVAAPAAEPGLDEPPARRTRESASPRLQDGRARMREPGSAEEPGGEKLVVGREQRAGGVENLDSCRLERAERPQAVVDAVERRQHVEAAQRRVAGAEAEEALLGRQDAAVEP